VGGGRVDRLRSGLTRYNRVNVKRVGIGVTAKIGVRVGMDLIGLKIGLKGERRKSNEIEGETGKTRRNGKRTGRFGAELAHII
jgi:hypothetical protein